MLTDSERFAFVPRRHHAFDTTGNAYDATQTDPAIATGDTLVVLDERVIGIAMTWPFAITTESGNLHAVEAPKSPETLEQFATKLGVPAASVTHAHALALALGYSLDPTIAALFEGPQSAI